MLGACSGEQPRPPVSRDRLSLAPRTSIDAIGALEPRVKDNCADCEEMSGFGAGTNAALNGTRSKPEVGGGGWDGKGRLE